MSKGGRQPLHKTAEQWRREHSFGQDVRRAGERRTLIVMAITAAAMVVEIAAGLAFGSMALLADGLNMASHAVAFGITLAAYVYARRFAGDPGFSFGTGKVNALAGFTSALLLAVFAALMAWESTARLLEPQPITFGPALVVALAGLAINAMSAVILRGRPAGEMPETGAAAAEGETDQNLRGAYLHVLADALTSILAVLALLAGKYAGLAWFDPVAGLAGALLVALWSYGLGRDTGRVLLDRQAPPALERRIIDSIERPDGTADSGAARVTDLHIWSIGPGIYSVAMALEASDPQSPEAYRARLPADRGLVHATIEIHRRAPQAHAVASPATQGRAVGAPARPKG